MGDRIIEVDGIQHVFPDDATDDEITAALGSGDAPSTNTGLTLAAAWKAVPVASNLVMRFATNPNVPKAMAGAGRLVGAISAPVVGASTAGPMGGLVGIAEMPKAAWAGGKTGWFGGKMLQGASRPIASVMERFAPYAQTLSTLGGAQGALDLAQMAEPNRKDIGFLGIGGGTPDPNDPALLNAIYAAVRKRLSGQP